MVDTIQPIDHFDHRYQNSESRIRRELEHAIARRRLDLRVVDICRAADISCPTFYAHHSSCKAALFSYELSLERELVYRLTPALDPCTATTILLLFVRKHKSYFNSASTGHNAYLIFKLTSATFEAIKWPTSYTIKPHLQDLYHSMVIALIDHWCRYERMSASAMDTYIKYILALRPKLKYLFGE